MEPVDDVGARVKAARVYARLEPQDLAKAVRAAGFRFSKRTLDRLEGGNRHLDVREARVIATTCCVPLTFLVRGWWAPPDLAERVAALEEEVTQGRTERDALVRFVDVIDGILQDRLGTSATLMLEQEPPQAASGRQSEAG